MTTVKPFTSKEKLNRYYLLKTGDNDCVMYNCIQAIGNKAKMYAWTEYHEGGESEATLISEGWIEDGHYTADGELYEPLVSEIREEHQGIMFSF